MLADRIEHRWIAAFERSIGLCRPEPGTPVAVLAETQSRELNVHLTELALFRLGCTPFRVTVPSPSQTAPMPVRSTGASQAIQGLEPVLAALTACDLVVDCTVEGLLHAPELPRILQSGTRILMVSNEHPDALERLLPDEELTPKVKAAAKLARGARMMSVVSRAGTNLSVVMDGAPTVGVWGYTEKPGTIAHWPGGIVVSFPKAGSVNGTLVLDRGDINLTFKRYLTDPVTLTIEDDYVVEVTGEGADAEMMRRTFAAWGDREAYAVSHVGWGMNPAARYEALAMYDQRDTNGTEQRAFAGNFLFSTGANEFAGRYTMGHFDIPVRGCSISLDGRDVVRDGDMVWEAFA